MAFGVAYSYCLYLLFFHQGKKRRQKKIKASTEAGEDGRVRVEDRKRTVFLGNTVGAYCIRPPDVPFMERITLKIDVFGAFAILRMAFGGRIRYAPTMVHGKWIQLGCSYLKRSSALGASPPCPALLFLS